MAYPMSRRAFLLPGGQTTVTAVDVLQVALELEQKTIVTHEHMNGHAMLAAAERSLCDKILVNHTHHTARLEHWLRALGASPKTASIPTPNLVTREETLKAAVQLERTLIEAYIAHAGDLSGAVLADAVQILVDETKHHTLISSWLNSCQA